MDKNTILGFLLIAAILVGFSIMNRPSEEELAREKAYNDSISLVAEAQQKAEMQQQALKAVTDTITANPNDSSEIEKVLNAHGDFKSSVLGEEKLFVLENELIKVTLSNKGGKVISAELKNYLSQDSLPVVLFNKDEADFSFTMATRNNHIINTSALYFQPVSEIKKDKEGNQQLTFRLQSDNEAYFDFTYTLPANDYMLDFVVNSKDMSTIMPLGSNYMIVNWNTKVRQQEKGRQFEERYASLNYKYVSDDMESLSESKDDSKKIANKVKWIAFKDQYFSSVLIAGKDFSNSTLESKMEPKESGYIKSYKAEMTVDYNPNGKEDLKFKFFFGPNKYKTLSSYDKGVPKDEKLKLRDLIPLGWGIFGWVNRFAIIPMFNLFSSFIGNFGIIILLMTIVINNVNKLMWLPK